MYYDLTSVGACRAFLSLSLSLALQSTPSSSLHSPTHLSPDNVLLVALHRLFDLREDGMDTVQETCRQSRMTTYSTSTRTRPMTRTTDLPCLPQSSSSKRYRRRGSWWERRFLVAKEKLGRREGSGAEPHFVPLARSLTHSTT